MGVVQFTPGGARDPFVHVTIGGAETTVPTAVLRPRVVAAGRHFTTEAFYMLAAMDNPATTAVSPIKSLLYWRKSKLNGAATVPVVLSLEPNGVLKMKNAAQETIFSVPANETTVQFTAWGTMVVRARSNQYDIVGVGASLSPKPSQQQLNELSAHPGSNSKDGTDLSRIGSAGTALSGGDGLGAVAGVAGSIGMQYAYYQGLEAIKVWQQTLPLAGSDVRKNSMNAMKYFTVALIAVVVIALAIGLLNK